MLTQCSCCKEYVTFAYLYADIFWDGAIHSFSLCPDCHLEHSLKRIAFEMVTAECYSDQIQATHFASLPLRIM